MDSYVPRRRPYPRPGSAVLMVLAWLVFNQACLGMLAFVPFVHSISIYSVPVALTSAVACVGLLHWSRELNHVSWRALLPFTRVTRAAWPPMILATLSLFTVIHAALALVRPAEFGALARLGANDYTALLLLRELAPMAFAVLVGAIAEELFFRGVILRGLLFYQSRPLAIAFSAALFGVVHLNLQQIPVAFAGGALWGWWYARSNSLWPGLVGHALHNALAISLPWILVALSGLLDPDTRMFPAAGVITLLVGSIVTLGTSILWCHRSLPRSNAHAMSDSAAAASTVSAPTPRLGRL